MAKKKKRTADSRIARYIQQLSEMSANNMTPLAAGYPMPRQRQTRPSAGGISDLLSLGNRPTVNNPSDALIQAITRGKNIVESRPGTHGANPFDRIPAARWDINQGALNTQPPVIQQPIDPYAVDSNALREEALRRVNMMFNPQINALQSQIGTARSNTAEAKSDIDIIYDALQTELERNAASSQQEMGRAGEMAEEAYGSALKDITGNYGSVADELARAIQAGGGDERVVAETVGTGLRGDQAFLEGLTRGDQAFAQEQASTLASELNTLNKQVIGQAGATKAGKMTAADRDLNNLINEITGRIGDIKGQRGMIVEDMIAQLMGAQQQAQESALDRQLKELQIAKGTGDIGIQGLTAQKMQQDLLGAPAEIRQGYGSAMDYLGQAGPQYQAAFNQFFSSGDLDERDPGQTIKKLAELAKKNNLDPNVLVNAWMRYAKQY